MSMRTNSRTRTAAVLGALAMTMTGAFSLAASASAQAILPDPAPAQLTRTAPGAATDKCTRGKLCGWPKPNYQGRVEIGDNDGKCWGTWNGDRSFSNQSGHTVRLYSSKKGCTGQYVDLKSGHGAEKLPFGVHHTQRI